MRAKKFYGQAAILAACGLIFGGLAACSSESSTSSSDATSFSSVTSAESSTASSDSSWKLAHSESFDKALNLDSVEWTVDTHGDDSPYHVDDFDDDGRYFENLGGEAFYRALAKANVLRKSVTFGDKDWLRLELAAQDLDGDGKPDSVPSLDIANGQGVINVPAWNTGLVITAAEALPSEYRVEVELTALDFGGKRDGSWEYEGKYNGYAPGECKTNFPWVRKGDYTQEGAAEVDPCASPWGDVTKENGYYFLSIMDYERPAPHNNIFIHKHRKVGMDSYSVDASWAKNYKNCNPETGELFEYTEGTGNGVNHIYFDGTSFRDPSFAYNQFVMPTPCGTFVGDVEGQTIVSAVEVQPELMPGEKYTFAIERTKDSYVTELTGNFKYVGQQTYRYERPFISDDGRAIWHYNQTADEYDGRFNQTLEFSGPYGSFSEEMWPAGSAYPDNFIVGIPHLNYYEGSASIDNLKLYTR
ncbi:MAG: hypothetical protein Q3972_00200 [Corynebacterium sp.]|nr:hypothetical protein [Corynebacterium sp.]